ncbi:hypothetical protein BGP_0056 [Beggiatoa sp. PS]|nr:hypothetical protein BGP_0056 [Beggiatoa sp. PS]
MSATGEATDAMIVGGLSRYDVTNRQYGTFNRIISPLGAKAPILTAVTIKVDSKHVGKKADLIVAGIHTLPAGLPYAYPNGGFQWYMLVGCSTCPKGWKVQALSTVENTPFPLLTKPELLPLKTIEQLPQYLTIEMFEGTFDTIGQLDMYVGYRVEEGEDQGKVIANIPGIEITLVE